MIIQYRQTQLVKHVNGEGKRNKNYSKQIKKKLSKEEWGRRRAEQMFNQLQIN